MGQFKDRLNQIIPKITSDEFLNSTGLGNEIAFYIFDYPPEKELEVRDHIQFVVEHVYKKNPDLKIIHINLFELLVKYLKSNDLLDRAIDLQKKKGDAHLLKALKGPLDGKRIANVFIQEAEPSKYNLVLVSGVGNTWPLIRSHHLLNNLHPLMETTPLVLFYPGRYSGADLSLFGRLKQTNYYRAFRLVP